MRPLAPPLESPIVQGFTGRLGQHRLVSRQRSSAQTSLLADLSIIPADAVLTLAFRKCLIFKAVFSSYYILCIIVGLVVACVP